ncbi:hypothetical protein [Lacticaseibacillus saniviri]|uniref:hypothetical protein n=1 Tax=Lacticaseibacillus saniviri TaxID=931533 RepID=UPI00070543E4|nr:hypothetical protein [Lacticaseibacillus saniviri]MCG4280895.1 hypothetical protein [Lacticaseibacillus saniviri]
MMNKLLAVFGIISAVASAGFFFKYMGSYDWNYAGISAFATTIAAYIAAVCIRDLVGSEHGKHD